MFRFESTVTSSPPTVLSNPPSKPGDEEGFDCTITFTRALPFPDRMSWRRSGEILVDGIAAGALAARTLVLLVRHSAEHKETSTAAATRRFRTWGRDIQFLQGQ